VWSLLDSEFLGHSSANFLKKAAPDFLHLFHQNIRVQVAVVGGWEVFGQKTNLHPEIICLPHDERVST